MVELLIVTLYLLNNEEQLYSCISNYSMKHVLIDSLDAPDFRLTFYNVKSL